MSHFFTRRHRHHAEAIEELDLQGILAFGTNSVPRLGSMGAGVLEPETRLQDLFSKGVAFDGKRFSRTVTATVFNYLPDDVGENVSFLSGNSVFRADG